MRSRSFLVLLAVAAVFTGVLVQDKAGDAAIPPAGSGVVFSVFENLPPNGACPGIYAVDARTRDISWLGGWDAQRRDSAVYPAFTSAGTFSYGQYVDPSANLLAVQIYAGGGSVAQAFAFTGWAWSPRREEVAYGQVSADGKSLALGLASTTGAKRVIAPATTGGVSWLPDGSGLVHMRRAGGDDVITFVRRDGRGSRDLARNAGVPRVSPDGKRVAFLRRVAPTSARFGVWIVPTSGGKARRVLSPATAAEALRLGPWLSSRELLVQRGPDSDVIFNAGDTVARLDVETGKRRTFLRHAFALSLSPDKRRVLFVRPHRGGETYYSIRTVGTDGRGQRLLAVTDEEDLNVGSMPVWKPASARVGWFGDPQPAGTNQQECVRRVTRLRDSTP
ncbi:MAG: TolB family protein [Gaiellaceae bacterium]